MLSAFHNLGHFEEVEGFLKFLLNIAHKHETSRDRLSPVYNLSLELPLPETMCVNWDGYQMSGPVRNRNQAAEHVQNDVYGEMILTLAPIFFDERFYHLRTRDHEGLLESLGKLCVKSIGQPDAGLWEIRNGWQEHTFTNLMSWAGLERLERIQSLGYLKNISIDLASERKRAEIAVERGVREGSVRNGPNDESYDAALSLLAILRFPNKDIVEATVKGICKALAVDRKGEGFYYRYIRNDDFGAPQSAFVVCSFWIAQALGQLGHIREAREILKKATQSANHLGLYSEHFTKEGNVQRGNFPQAYSHVGLINTAFTVSPPWSEIL